MRRRAKPTEPATDRPALAEATARAMAGDEAAVAEVRRLLRDPAQFRAFGDLAQMARTRILTDLVGDSPLFREAVPELLAALRRELAGPDPNPIEALLVERILTNWLALHGLELRRGAGAGLGPAAAAWHERAVDGAHRRYVASLKALATVRKLALPVLQVNLAHHQVNVGSAGCAIQGPQTPAPNPAPTEGAGGTTPDVRSARDRRKPSGRGRSVE